MASGVSLRVSVRSKLWLGAAVGCVVVQIAGALLLRQSFQLAALSDLVQCALLASGLLALLPHALKTQGRVRAFWGLMTLGLAFWLAYQIMWTYFEVILRTDVPDLFAGDIVLFLHIVPMIAALALRPHTGQDEYSARLGSLDFALLATGWVYLWALMILPWQYAQVDVFAYNQNFNTVYLAEKLALLVALTVAWSRTRSAWQETYGQLLGASFMYASSSYVANWAIGSNAYYSGSLYDVPLTVSMAWITYIGLTSEARSPEPGSATVSTTYGVWLARLGMMAVISLPLFGAWAFYTTAEPGPVRFFRIVLTLGTAVAMGIMVFVRQHLLDRELLQLLGSSQQSVEDLRDLQTQLTESEKLASMGKLVGGVAHELNNPITAMLGYSDILGDTQLDPEQKALAERIGQHVRQTQSLVASLLSFAKSSGTSRTPLDMNTLARTAVKLSEAQHKALRLQVRVELTAPLPPIVGDSNQLLQVCTHMISSVLYNGGGPAQGTLLISTLDSRDGVVFQVSHWPESRSQTAPTKEHREHASNGLALCFNIVRQHDGSLDLSVGEAGKLTAKLELPTSTAVSRLPGNLRPLAERAQSFV
jgi:signal transduction histidine kinase